MLLEIAELLSRLHFNPSQLQELFAALTDIATNVNNPTSQALDDTFDVINDEDVPQDVSSKGSSDATAAPSASAAEPTIESSLAPSNGDRDTAADAPSIVTTTPTAVTTTPSAVSPTGAAVVVAPAAPVPIAAPAATSTTRLFNGVSYQYPAEGASGPFYLVTRGRDIGVFVGWFVFFFIDSFCVVDLHFIRENTSPLVTRVSASVSFRVPSAEEGRLRMESSIAAGFARRV